MYHQLGYQQFIEFLYKLCWQKSSGFVFFSTVDEAWGKVKLHEGDIVAIGYKSVWGADSLASIRGIPQVKCFFQKNTLADDEEPPQRHPSLASTAEILTFLLSNNAPQGVLEARQSLERERVEVEQEERRDTPKARVGEKQILVADDSQVMRRVISNALTSASYLVTEARDGYEAIGLAEDIRPDLMIVDVQMPGIDGFRVLSTIRNNRRLRETPVFLLTASSGILPRLKGRIADCEEFLEKPLDFARLLKLVRKHLQGIDL